MIRLLLLASIIPVAIPTTAAASECLHYDLPAVQISGRISREPLIPVATATAEQPEYAWYFEPAKPLCVDPGPENLGNLAMADVKRFEIVPPTEQSGFDSYLGQNVLIVGLFVPTYLPHFHSNLMFTVESVPAQPGP